MNLKEERELVGSRSFHENSGRLLKKLPLPIQSKNVTFRLDFYNGLILPGEQS